MMRIIILIATLFIAGCFVATKPSVPPCPSEPMDLYIMTPLGPWPVHFDIGEMDTLMKEGMSAPKPAAPAPIDQNDVKLHDTR